MSAGIAAVADIVKLCSLKFIKGRIFPEMVQEMVVVDGVVELAVVADAVVAAT